jgi:REP element-mobilizing transposase RayT
MMREETSRKSSGNNNPRYYLFWTTRRSKRVLKGEVAERLEKLMIKSCREMGVEIVTMEIMLDYVDLVVESPPELSPKKIVSKIKRYTAHHLREEARAKRAKIEGLIGQQKKLKGRTPKTKIKDALVALTKMPSMWTRDALFRSTMIPIKDKRDFLASVLEKNAVEEL